MTASGLTAATATPPAGVILTPRPPKVLAIDPGPTESGWALVDTATCRPLNCGKTENAALLSRLWDSSTLNLGMRWNYSAVEMIASYGMAVGAEVFETCVWIGRFYEAMALRGKPELIYRREVKLHHCGTSAAKDSNITQALIDRFAHGQGNRGKGTKAAPGWFYGFSKDIWQAHALAVLVADRLEGRAR